MVANLVARMIFSQDILTRRIIKRRIMKDNKDKLKSMTGKPVQTKEYNMELMYVSNTIKKVWEVLSSIDQTLLQNQRTFETKKQQHAKGSE